MPGPKAPEDTRRRDLLRAAFTVAAEDGLAGLTTRAVAAEAGVSQGLVFFHFGNREALVVALLDWLLASVLRHRADRLGPDAPPTARLYDLVAREIAALPASRARVQMLFDFWVMGMHHKDVQARIRRALDLYRRDFQPYAEAVIAAAPERFVGTTPEGMAAAVTAIIEGVALQVVIDPKGVDLAAVQAALRALVPLSGDDAPIPA